MEGRKRTLAIVLKLVINENDKTERKRGGGREKKKQTNIGTNLTKQEGVFNFSYFYY